MMASNGANNSLNRYDVLEKMTTKARDKWTKMQEARLTDYFSSLPKSVTRDKKFVSAMVSKVHSLMGQEIDDTFQELYQEINIKEKLEQLDRLDEQQKQHRGKDAWRPSGCPLSDQAILEMPTILDVCDKLQASVVQEEFQVKSLMEEAERIQNEIQAADCEIAECLQRGNQAQQRLNSYIQAQVHARAGLPPPQVHHPVQLSSPPMHMGHRSASIGARPPPPPPGAVVSAPPKNSSGAPVESTAASTAEDDSEDIMAKLLMLEKEVKQEKKEKKKAAKAAKTGSAPTGSTPFVPSSLKTAPPPTGVKVASSISGASGLAARANAPPPAASISDDSIGKAKKQKRIVRTGGGQIWEDDSLKDWDTNDFRIFCGDLGNDVTDEVLARTFGRYPSFQKAKVIRDKKTNKTRGYGFVSFKEPADFTKAMREINGKYVGSRPIKLRKSNWKDRNIDVVRHKQKVKQQMGYKW